MQRGSATILLIMGLLIALGVGSFWYYFQTIHKAPVENPIVIGHRIAVDLTYKSNNNLGFEFKYSEGLIAKEDNEEAYNKRGNGDFRKNFRGYVGYPPGEFLGAATLLKDSSSKAYDESPFTVWVFDNPDNLTIEAWYGKYWYYPFVWGDFTYDGKLKTSPQNIATVSGQITKSGIVAYSPGSPKFIYLPVDNKMYLFRVINGQEKIGDQILATFKLPEVVENRAECLRDQDCGQGFLCDIDRYCAVVPGGALCNESVTKTCLKKCETDTDCSDNLICSDYGRSEGGDAKLSFRVCKSKP